MKYILVLDTETANTFQNEKGQLDSTNALVYDIGWVITDRQGNIYEKRSYINADVFIKEKSLMKTSYYANKIPKYWSDYRLGLRRCASFEHIRTVMLEDMVSYGIEVVSAHNARFDYNALNSTYRYLTKSSRRYFFPRNVVIWDTMKMANDTICKMKKYKKFCKDNGYLTPNGVPRKSAEVLYRFLSKDNEFIESHTGLEDVLIETKILTECLRTKKKMRKDLFNNILTEVPLTDGRENAIIKPSVEIDLFTVSLTNRIKRLSANPKNRKIIAKLQRRLNYGQIR